jgi:hypothetical protein
MGLRRQTCNSCGGCGVPPEWLISTLVCGAVGFAAGLVTAATTPNPWSAGGVGFIVGGICSYAIDPFGSDVADGDEFVAAVHLWGGNQASSETWRFRPGLGWVLISYEYVRWWVCPALARLADAVAAGEHIWPGTYCGRNCGATRSSAARSGLTSRALA